MYVIDYDENNKKKKIDITNEDYNKIISGLFALQTFDEAYEKIFGCSWSEALEYDSPKEVLKQFTEYCLCDKRDWK